MEHPHTQSWIPRPSEQSPSRASIITSSLILVVVVHVYVSEDRLEPTTDGGRLDEKRLRRDNFGFSNLSGIFLQVENQFWIFSRRVLKFNLKIPQIFSSCNLET